MTIKLRSFTNSVSSIKLHIVLVIAYRREVITEEIELEILEMIDNICRKNDCILEQGKADLLEGAHLHLLIDMAPKVTPSVLVNTIKTVTSREIRRRHREYLQPYLWGKSFWKRGYSILSSGGATIDTLKKYIEEQGLAAPEH